VTLDVVEYVANVYPNAVEKESEESEIGWYPLHLACRNQMCPRPVVELLLSKYPEAAKICHRGCNSGFGLPLHLMVSRITVQFSDDYSTIVQNNIPLDLGAVKMLMDMYPEALENRENSARYTPLLHACEREDVTLELIKMLAGQENRCLTLTGSYCRGLPLHAIFGRGVGYPPPYDAIKFLIESSLPSLAMPNRTGQSTFHSACGSKSISLEVVKLFVKTQRDLIERVDNSGNLPLHALCRNNALDETSSLEIAKYLIDEYPGAVRRHNRHGTLPIDYAAGAPGISLELVKFLVNKYPESVRELDERNDHCLPFHDACRSGSFETMKYLFELYPESIRIKMYGDLPLHTATENSHSKGEYDSKIRFLVEKYPDASSLLGSIDDLPLHRACERSMDLPVIKFLFEAYPEGIVSRNVEGRLAAVGVKAM